MTHDDIERRPTRPDGGTATRDDGGPDRGTAALDHDHDRDVLIVGGGPAGLSAGLYTARAGLDTLVVDEGESILQRNAFLENYPGFPAGIDARRLLEMMGDGAERAGCDRRDGRVVDLAPLSGTDGAGESDGAGGDDAARTGTDAGEEPGDDPPGFLAEVEDGWTVSAEYVVAATKNTVEFLAAIDGVGILTRGKTFVDTDERGRTGVPGLYAAGRLAYQPYQTIVVAGHGASVGLAVIEDSDVNFYHDWVTPDRYFTGRGRDLPPGCEEITAAERRRRERDAIEITRSYFEAPYPGEPTQHPSVRED